jgi:hypothetical protein
VQQDTGVLKGFGEEFILISPSLIEERTATNHGTSADGLLQTQLLKQKTEERRNKSIYFFIFLNFFLNQPFLEL